MSEIKWYVRLPGYRTTGIYEDIEHLASYEDCKDFYLDDIENQPESVKPFLNDYMEYSKTNWTNIDDYYHKIWSKK